MNKPLNIVLVDDHALVRESMAELITNLGYNVLYQCNNGIDLKAKIYKTDAPDIILMDISMKGLDGFETTRWLKENFPLIKVLVVSMREDEGSIIKMLKEGARGFLVKDADTKELNKAIMDVHEKGYYYSDLVSGKLIHSIQAEENSDEQSDANLVIGLSEREIAFLKLAASDFTYKEIADAMHLSPRTIDGYRDSLFDKLNVRSRSGLVTFAFKNRIVTVE